MAASSAFRFVDRWTSSLRDLVIQLLPADPAREVLLQTLDRRDLELEAFLADSTGWRAVGGTGVDEPAFQNSWVNYAGGWHVAAFRRVGDVIEMRGLVKDGTVGGSTPIFTLPAGYRPTSDLLFPTIANNAIGRINVFDSGDVCSELGANTFVALNLSFAVT